MFEMRQRLLESERLAVRQEPTMHMFAEWAGVGTRLHVHYPQISTPVTVDGFFMTRVDGSLADSNLHPTVVRLRYRQLDAVHKPNIVDYLFYDNVAVKPTMCILHEGQADDAIASELNDARRDLIVHQYLPAILEAKTSEIEASYLSDLLREPADRPMIWPSIGLSMEDTGPIPPYVPLGKRF